MIISHKFKFIFVKTGKVAGTSVEIALRPFLGERDVITPVDSRDEYYATQNDIPSPRNYGRIYWNDKMQIHNLKGCFYEHAYASEIKGIVGDSIWDEYFTFTIDRDPRDKSLSTFYYHKYGIKLPFLKTLYYYYLLRQGQSKKTTSSTSVNSLSPMIAKACNLERWLIEDTNHAFSQNFYRYSCNGKVIVDKVFPFNQLHKLESYLSEIVGEKLTFPKLKSGFRKDKIEPITNKEKELLEGLMENPIFQKEMDIINAYKD